MRSAELYQAGRLFELLPSAPNELWQADVTYIHIPGPGWRYAVTVIDHYSRYLLACHRRTLKDSYRLCFDRRIVAEYWDVLTRGCLGLDGERVDTFLENVEAVLVETLALPHAADGMFVEVAVAGHADCIKTGNAKHFSEDRLRGVRVRSPRAFLQEFLEQYTVRSSPR